MITCDWCKQVSGAANVTHARVSIVADYARHMESEAEKDEDYKNRAVFELCLDCIPKARAAVRAMIFKAGCQQPEKML